MNAHVIFEPGFGDKRGLAQTAVMITNLKVMENVFMSMLFVGRCVIAIFALYKSVFMNSKMFFEHVIVFAMKGAVFTRETVLSTRDSSAFSVEHRLVLPNTTGGVSNELAEWLVAS